mgnify:CR=1 FL=1
MTKLFNKVWQSVASYFSLVETPSAKKTRPVDRTNDLISQGWKVKVRHLRYFPFLEDEGEPAFLTKYEYLTKINPKFYAENVWPVGGRTEVVLVTPEGKEYKGVAKCSFEDNFNRKEGRAWAIDRAYQNYLNEVK